MLASEELSLRNIQDLFDAADYSLSIKKRRNPQIHPLKRERERESEREDDESGHDGDDDESGHDGDDDNDGQMSTFTMVHHTAPHIPFKHSHEWNAAQAQLNGTAHCDYPHWIKALCHDISIHIPHHISPGIPTYNLRAAHQSLHNNWGKVGKVITRWKTCIGKFNSFVLPNFSSVFFWRRHQQYLNEATWNWRLKQTILTVCHVYNKEQNYIPFDEIAPKESYPITFLKRDTEMNLLTPMLNGNIVE